MAVSVQTVRSVMLSHDSACCEKDPFTTSNLFCTSVPNNVLDLLRSTHGIFQELIEDGVHQTKVASGERTLGIQRFASQDKKVPSTGKPPLAAPINRSQILSLRCSQLSAGNGQLPHGVSLPRAHSLTGEVLQKMEAQIRSGAAARRHQTSQSDPGPEAWLSSRGLHGYTLKDIIDRAALSSAAGSELYVLPGSNHGSAQGAHFDQAEAGGKQDAGLEGEPSSEEDEPSDGEAGVEVVIGPTPMAVQPYVMEELHIPDSFSDGGKRAIVSCSNRVSIGEVSRLRVLPDGSDCPLPVSFGSVLHICGHEQHCRPCMFERSAGRCRKGWLCDFCHMHNRRKRKVAPVPWKYPGAE